MWHLIWMGIIWHARVFSIGSKKLHPDRALILKQVLVVFHTYNVLKVKQGKIVKLPLSSTLSCPAPDLNFPAMPERRVRIGEQINVTCTSSGSVRFKSWNWVAPSGVDTRGVSDWFVFNATREIIGENVITCMSNGPGGKAQEVSSVFVADDYWTNIFYSSLSGVRFRSI